MVTGWWTGGWTVVWWSGLTLALLPRTPPSSDNAGRWCPQVSRRLVACVQPQWLWTPDGRIHQQKKKVYRWKKDIQWSCCPGFQGENCDQQCFHCTMVHDIISRLESAEAVVSSLRYKDAAVKNAGPANVSRCLCPRGPKGDTGPQGPRGPRGHHHGLPASIASEEAGVDDEVEGQRSQGQRSQGQSSQGQRLQGQRSQGRSGPAGRPGPKGDTGERGPPGPRGKRGPRAKPSEAGIKREQEQDKQISVLETRVQELEGEVAEMQALLNTSGRLSEQFDLLQKRIVHLEDLFLHTPEGTDDAAPPNTTQRRVGPPSTLKQHHNHHQHHQQAQDPHTPPLLSAAAAREFRASPTLTARHGPHGTRVTCSCGVKGLPPPPPPPPFPPLPVEVLEALFPGQNVTVQLLATPGFCRRFREELKELFRKSFDPRLPTRSSTTPAPSRVPHTGSLPPPPVASKTGGEKNSQPAQNTSATSPPGTRKVKVIDLMKNWKPLQTESPPSREKDASSEEREIIRQFSQEFTKPRSRNGSLRTVASVSVCLSTVVMAVFCMCMVGL